MDVDQTDQVSNSTKWYFLNSFGRLIRIEIRWNRDNHVVIFYVLGYYNGQSGGVCREESHVIRREPECTSALIELGYQLPHEDYYDRPNMDWPSGCSIKIEIGMEKIYPHLGFGPGLGTGNDAFTPICRGPERTNYFLFRLVFTLRK